MQIQSVGVFSQIYRVEKGAMKLTEATEFIYIWEKIVFGY